MDPRLAYPCQIVISDAHFIEAMHAAKLEAERKIKDLKEMVDIIDYHIREVAETDNQLRADVMIEVAATIAKL